MKLHEAISQVLQENGRPMTAREIASIINSKSYYTRSDREPVKAGQIHARIKNYNSLFQNINGQIILVENESWKNLLTSYWYLANLLRGIYIVNDIQFIIAVLFFYRRLLDINDRPGRRYPIDFHHNLKTDLDRVLDSGKSFVDGLRSIEQYSIAPEGIFDDCAKLLGKLDGYKIVEIWSIIRKTETADLSDIDFGNIYEYFLTLAPLDGFKSPINHTPYSLRELMVSLLQPSLNSTVYDPVSGTGGLLVQTLIDCEDLNIHAKGTEINKRITQLGNLNLIMHGFENAKIVAQDCFEGINNIRKYDYIIADLPVNGITNSFEHEILYHIFDIKPSKSKNSFSSLILLILSKLSPKGKAVITVSDSFLTKGGIEQQIRALLVQQDVIETIISLPYGTLRPYTDAKASLMVLNKSKPTYLINRIKFITANAVDQDSKSLYLNNDDILHAYDAQSTFSKHAKIIYNDDLLPRNIIAADAYNAEYLLANEMLKDGTAKFLSELVEIKAGTQPHKADIGLDGDLSLVKIEDLSKDILDTILETDNLNKVHNTHYSRHIISKESILVAKVGDNLKATIFKPNPNTSQIIAHSNVYVLLPNKDVVDIEYLYYQLHSSFISEQLDRKRLGAVMPYISISALKEIIIPYLDIIGQKNFVHSQKANLIAAERIRVEERIKALDYKEEVKQTESDVIKVLTHQLRPKCLDLSNLANRIKRIVDDNNIGDLTEYKNLILEVDPEIAEHTIMPDNFTLKKLLDKLIANSKHLSDTLDTVDKVMNFKLSEEELKEVEVLTFLKNYKKQKDIEINGKYEIKVAGEPANALINEAVFGQLLDQLLLNAEKHGFIDKQKTHTAQFFVRNIKQRGVISIEYSNNGTPFELKQKDFTSAFEKGKKSNGSGIGGNFIYRIVEAHHGKLIVVENNHKGFSLTIELPNLNNQENE